MRRCFVRITCVRQFHAIWPIKVRLCKTESSSRILPAISNSRYKNYRILPEQFKISTHHLLIRLHDFPCGHISYRKASETIENWYESHHPGRCQSRSSCTRTTHMIFATTTKATFNQDPFGPNDSRIPSTYSTRDARWQNLSSIACTVGGSNRNQIPYTSHKHK